MHIQTYTKAYPRTKGERGGEAVTIILTLFSPHRGSQNKVQGGCVKNGQILAGSYSYVKRQQFFSLFVLSASRLKSAPHPIPPALPRRSCLPLASPFYPFSSSLAPPSSLLLNPSLGSL